MSTPTYDVINTPLSILVVDDEELNQRLMRVLLTREGHQVEFASNGEEAVDAVKNGTYDMVLMDLQMPIMDGVEASHRIREWESEDAHTYIVALTASYLPERGQELYEAGIDNYIAKPFDMEHLRHILEASREHHKSRSSLEKGDPDSQVDDEQGSLSILDHRIGVQRVGGDREIYKDLLSDFIKELPDKIEKLWASFHEKKMEELYRSAHNLKGVSANLGALQLSENARRLEKLEGAGYTGTIEPILKEITATSGRLMETVADLLSSEELNV